MLIDGCRDRFVKSLSDTKQHSRSKRTFSIDTTVIYSMAQEYLDDYFEIYLTKNLKDKYEAVHRYMSEYIFTDLDLDELLEKHDISKKEFDAAYTSFYKGFKVLYGEELECS
jgi:hypothetical protein